jgi:hypothetical protein
VKSLLRATLVVAAVVFALNAHGANRFSTLIIEAMHSTDVLQTDFGEYHTLTHVEPADNAKTHTADYFSLVGAIVSGQYQPIYVSIVSENWLKIADGWIIDQWDFKVTLDGTMVLAAHSSIFEKDDSTVLSAPQPKAPTKSEASAQLRKIEANWMEWVGRRT